MKRILFGHPLSGNTHRVRMLLSILKLPYEEVSVDIPAGEQRRPEFLKLNPLGLVPVLIEGERSVRDSHAILFYVAAKYGADEWMPKDPESMASVMQWMSFSANEIQNGANMARLHFLLGAPIDLSAAQSKAKHALQLVNEHLQNRDWLELGRPTLADLACYPYLALAEEGKVSLADYANVRDWITRIKALPGYVAMPGL
jgi:glutathione S-transferase